MDKFKPGTRVRVKDLIDGFRGKEGTVIDPSTLEGYSLGPRSDWNTCVAMDDNDSDSFWFAKDELEVIEDAVSGPEASRPSDDET